MLAPGNYVQWKSRIKRYIDTKPNSELIHYCLQNPPYTYQWAEKTVPVAEGSSETTTERYMENYKNVSQDIRDQLNAEAEAVQIILTGIDNDIYSTVDACPNACEMWKAIERLKQGESINVQDLETNLYWEFGKFTSRDGESLESYYSWFYKMMNELVRNQCHVTNHQVNVQFLLQLQPEWQRFVTLVKQSQELKTVSYHKLYDILKQHQNEIRSERLHVLLIPLAHVAHQQPFTTSKPSYSNHAIFLNNRTSTRNRGKAIVTLFCSDYMIQPATVTDKKIYKPTNNNLRTSSNTSRANQDNSPRINRGTGYDNQRAVNVAGARENVGKVDWAKAKGDLMSYKIDFAKSSNAYTQQINDLNQTISDMKKELCAHQETISIMPSSKRAQTKLYKLEKYKEIENKNGQVWKYQIAPISWLWRSVQERLTIKRVYYVEGLNHNLYSVGQFYDADLEVAFWKSTCYIRDLKGNDLLTGSRGTDLYSISLQDSTTPNPICLMAKATSSQAWLWHRRLSHLNFDTINLLSKNNIVNGLPKLKFVKDHLCFFLELGKQKKRTSSQCLTTVRTVKGQKNKKFSNKTLHAYFAKEGIRHETSTARTPEQNGVVERRNRTLVEAARTMLSAAKVPFLSHLGSLVTSSENGEILDKMKEKGDACILLGILSSKAYRVFNKRTRMIVETIHVNFDELPQMASDHVSSDPGPQCSTTVLEQDSLSPGPQSQENVPQVAETVTTSNELELLYSPMFSELLNGTSHVVSKSSAVHAADNPDKRQQHNTTHTSTTTDVADPPPLNIHSTHPTPTQVPTVTAPENIHQAETNTENAQFDDDEFINIFSTPVQEPGETSSRHVDTSNMHTFYQHHPSAQRWTKDHPLEQVIGNPSQSAWTKDHPLEQVIRTDGEMCMFALTVSGTEPKNIKEAMADSAWIESMQEVLSQCEDEIEE
ncbi:integrase, catalytic region, zinc finger, CCHC-type containing protein [Tanacetum coccineum]